MTRERLILMLSTVNPGPVDPKIAADCHWTAAYLLNGSRKPMPKMVKRLRQHAKVAGPYVGGYCRHGAIHLERSFL